MEKNKGGLYAMRIAILGAGAMGSLIGAFLQKSGEDVLLVDPYEEHMKKIRTDGLTLHLNDNEEIVKMNTVTSAKGQKPVDLLIVLVKGNYTDHALKGAKELIGKDTYLLTLQNGIGNSEVLRNYVSDEHVLKGVMKIASRMEAPGVIASRTMAGVPALFLGCECQDEKAIEVVKTLEADFQSVDVCALYKEDIDFYIWSKAVNNIAVNCACGIARTNIKDFLSTEDGWKILKGCVSEVVAVANAKGIPLENDAVIKTIKENTIPKIGSHLPSSAQDMKAQKNTEIDTLNGAIVCMGEQLQISTPCNAFILHFVKVIEANYDNQF